MPLGKATPSIIAIIAVQKVAFLFNTFFGIFISFGYRCFLIAFTERAVARIVDKYFTVVR